MESVQASMIEDAKETEENINETTEIENEVEPE